MSGKSNALRPKEQTVITAPVTWNGGSSAALSDMAVSNPAPNASPSREATGVYRIVDTSPDGHSS
jgi:hypothetical protein